MRGISERLVRLMVVTALAAGQVAVARTPPGAGAQGRVSLDIRQVRLVERKRDRDVFEVSWEIISPRDARIKTLLVELELVEEKAAAPQRRSFKKTFTFGDGQASKTQLATEVVSFQVTTVNGKRVFPALQFNASLSGQMVIPSEGSDGQAVRFSANKTGRVVVNHEEQ